MKDLFATKGIRTTASSRVLADHVPDHDATVVERLRAAGAILDRQDEHAGVRLRRGPPTTTAPTPNPWDLARSSSGSSSGSAVAVAAGMGYGSIGSDTGGSIRLPAAYCGIVGLKPTYGRVSRHGGIPVSWSADHFGPMTRTVADAAALLGAIAGEDPRDPTSGRVPVPDYLAEIDAGIAGKRIGIADAYLRQHVDPEVRPPGRRRALPPWNVSGRRIVEIDSAATVRGRAGAAGHPDAGSYRLSPALVARAPGRLQPGRARAAGAGSDDARGLLHPGATGAAAIRRRFPGAPWTASICS